MLARSALLLLAAACLAGCLASVDAAAAPKKCFVVAPGAKVPAAGVVGWSPKATTFRNALGLAFGAGELFEADPVWAKAKCPPHTGESVAERMAIKIMGVCTKINLKGQSNLYRVETLIAYPCKGRKASVLTTKTGKYACAKNRWCTKLFITANAPFAFDFEALAGMAGGQGEGEGYGEVLSSILDLNMVITRHT